MFQKVFAFALIASLSSQAMAAADLTCRTAPLSIEKLDNSAADVSNPLVLRIDDRTNAIGFMADQIKEVRTRHHRVIMADNGFIKARIVVNESGQADLTVQDGNGGIMILRKVVRCLKF